MVPGCILSGGEARRLGGKGKALIKISNHLMIDLVISNVSNQVSSLSINTRENIKLNNKYLHIQDAFKIKGGAGPLAGILSAIKWAKTTFPNVNYVLTVPVDCPFIPEDLVINLLKPLSDDSYDVVVASSNGNIHPVIALWSLNLDVALEDSLNSGVRKIDIFTSDFNIKVIDWKFDNFDPFFNINRFEDIKIAESYLKC